MAPRATIDVGDGLDYGYVRGFYPPEQQQGANARWTDGRGAIRLNPPDAAANTMIAVSLRLAAPHPNAGETQTDICVGKVCRPLLLGPTWRSYTLVFPPTAGPIEVEIQSPTFQDASGRPLGVLVDWATVAPAN
jgi:hypothetical protein